MSEAIRSSEQMIEKINQTLQTKKNATICIINDKLTLSVFTLLEKNLKNVKEINFIIRDTKFVPTAESISHELEIAPADVLYNSYDIVEKNKLKHFAKAKAMHDFIQKNVHVRKVNPNIKIGGNIIIIDEDFMIQGSSSLEISPKKARNSHKNFNFDTMLTDSVNQEQILNFKNTFNQIWYGEEYSSDYKENLLQSLEYVYKEYSPEFLYYFTLNELFGYQIDNNLDTFERTSEKFKKSQIWKSLFSFQKDCVVSAIQKLQKYGGCIIADSVGLGKTFEALAVIKYFEIKMDNVLVLTPAKLYDNWNSFRGTYTDSQFSEVFNYKIMFHTDLSRYKGMSVSGQDLERFDWGNYDLVVIDESHNFRNRNDRYDDNDELIMTRYARLMEHVIKKGKNNTKVLLLSATPVNNSLVDLKNQLSIITGDRDFAFEEEGIPSVENLLRKSATTINAWEKLPNHSKEDLLDSLPANFYKLLELITISRSRKHITNYYNDANLGSFPAKNKPITLRPEIDTRAELLGFENTNELLEILNLSVYTPTSYIKSQYHTLYTKKYNLTGKYGGNMDFMRQSRGMIVMHRFNLFKRLESSVFSFSETIRRLIERIERSLEILERGDTTLNQNIDTYDDEYDRLEGKYEINVNHLRVNDYITDLNHDLVVLKEVYNDTNKVLNNDRDYKLQTLRAKILDKVKNTPYNTGNKKVLIFTAFSDTSDYLYQKLSNELLEHGIHIAAVSGRTVKTNNKKVDANFNSVLSAFSPLSKKGKEIPQNEQIDILIGTDCISEGQNLQDCDTVINYDIQWNPVSLIQRFGRIDRIGSKNTNIQMINFFPNMELNAYLGLEQRVKGKMTTLNIVSTGDEDFLTPEMNDFNFRRQQLEKLKDEVIDIEDASDNISLTDLNMNEYLFELSEYLEKNPQIKAIPQGIYSLTHGADKGVLFCFKHSEREDKPKSDSSLYPYYLIYMADSGDVLYGNTKAREVVKLFRRLCYGKNESISELFKIFFTQTNNTKKMAFYSDLLNKAVQSIKGEEEAKAVQTVFDFSGFNNAFADENADDFELISFLVVK